MLEFLQILGGIALGGLCIIFITAVFIQAVQWAVADKLEELELRVLRLVEKEIKEAECSKKRSK